MCGIGGKLSFGTRPDPGIAEEMNECMVHRGPDAEGVYASGPALLAHRRLSILDLSEAGRQPMSNADDSVWVVFNGEIYNYRELRDNVDHYPYKSETDTEVLLHLYEEFGVKCLERLRGMFAFAIWDENDNRLFLARDRLGQKPLFYRRDDGAFWFGSTIKTILADDAVDTKPDLDAIRSFLTYSFVPQPSTGFEGISQLGPAEYMIVTEDGIERDTYWEFSHSDQFSASVGSLVDRLRDELRESTRLRLRSDVPLGVFLSGGIDSSIVTALLAETAETEVETYSIGFDVGEYNELGFAREVAEMHGTDHHEYTVTPDSIAVLPELIEHYEMPFGDPSAVPTYYVSEAASQDITVALTGDAGDENFAGYDRYTFDRITSLAARVPKPLRKAVRGGIEILPEEVIDGTQVARLRRLLDTANRDSLERYTGYIYIGEDADDRVERRAWAGDQPEDELLYLREVFNRADGPTRLDRLMGTDLRTYLPDDLLVKIDRASMAHSLEVRSPFLDHKFVEFASRIPAKYKWRRGEKKWLLKRAFRDELPDRVLRRSKQGFGVPTDEWFRGELREHADEKLTRLGSRSPFDAAVLDEAFNAHLREETDLGGKIWNFVVLESWYEQFID